MRRLILIEGLPKYEGVNEAQALADALQLMMKGYDGRRTKSLKIMSHTATDKRDFLKWLERKTDLLHITRPSRKSANNTLHYKKR